jgi:small subunit ribosomal protein S6e
MVKVVVADPETGKSYSVEIQESAMRGLIGLRIGDKFSGAILGLPGYELQITGGMDKNGFPMRADIPGVGRVGILLASGPGFSPRKRGERRRKLVRGSTISDSINQINVKVLKRGEKSIEELLKKG